MLKDTELPQDKEVDTRPLIEKLGSSCVEKYLSTGSVLNIDETINRILESLDKPIIETFTTLVNESGTQTIPSPDDLFDSNMGYTTWDEFLFDASVYILERWVYENHPEIKEEENKRSKW